MNNLKLYNLTIPQKAIYLAEQYSSGTSLNSIGGNLIIEENKEEETKNIFKIMYYSNIILW